MKQPALAGLLVTFMGLELNQIGIDATRKNRDDKNWGRTERGQSLRCCDVNPKRRKGTFLQALEFPCNRYICYLNLFILKESMSHFIVLEIQNLPYIRDENTKKIRFSLQLVSHEVSSVTLNLVNRYFSWHSDKGAANDIIILLKSHRWIQMSIFFFGQP